MDAVGPSGTGALDAPEGGTGRSPYRHSRSAARPPARERCADFRERKNVHVLALVVVDRDVPRLDVNAEPIPNRVP